MWHLLNHRCILALIETFIIIIIYTQPVTGLYLTGGWCVFCDCVTAVGERWVQAGLRPCQGWIWKTGSAASIHRSTEQFLGRTSPQPGQQRRSTSVLQPAAADCFLLKYVFFFVFCFPKCLVGVMKCKHSYDFLSKCQLRAVCNRWQQLFYLTDFEFNSCPFIVYTFGINLLFPIVWCGVYIYLLEILINLFVMANLLLSL